MFLTAIFITVTDCIYGVLFLKSHKVASTTRTDGTHDWQFVSGAQNAISGAVAKTERVKAMFDGTK